jgi:hypothetical protein
MAAQKPPPRVALAHWLTKIHYNAIRKIETVFSHVVCEGRPLRGFKIADDLVLTRKREFYRIVGPVATPMSVQEVSANYNLETLQLTYRKATEMWKTAHRRRVAS